MRRCSPLPHLARVKGLAQPDVEIHRFHFVTVRVKPTTKPESGPRRAMRRLGLESDTDLALHLPLRYEDETRITPIAQASPGDVVQVEATVSDVRTEQRTRPQLVVRVSDGTADLVLRFLHVHPSHRKTFTPGNRVRLRGELRGGFFGHEMVHPAYRVVHGNEPLPTTLTPVYPASAQLPQAYLRRAIASALQRVRLDEVLPAYLVPAGLPSLCDALLQLHQPPPQARAPLLADAADPAWQRLKFEELLAQQLAQRLARDERSRLRAPVLVAADAEGAGTTNLRQRLIDALGFELTAAQRRVVREIEADLAAPRPMHRLLQGDVGCGKTVVAALAAAATIDAGWQCVLMAPTEILAEQHLRKLVQWLQPLGVQVAWLSGSRRGKLRERERERVQSGEAQLVVGTQAVIEDDVHFARLGLAVVDEQHRFGVAQRLALRRKLAPAPSPPVPHGGEPLEPLEPHLLTMSATPIPRTLAMSYFADLDVSTIDELPPGRAPVQTRVFSLARRNDVIARLRHEMAQGRQAYWVCPLIEEGDESEAPTDTRPRALALRAAADAHRDLAQALGSDVVGLVHGRLKAKDKAAVMAAFTAGTIAVLVATTVIEVGLDVPNASLMVIEQAERFGLAQLHQLRGRIGRGSTGGVCVLLYGTPLGETARARLKAMTQTHDGFEIARLDLQIRGPGEFIGTRQSGDMLLRFADLQDDSLLLQQAREAATVLLAEHHDAALAHVRRWLRGRIDFTKA
jgi:ATP-dependent DNA helicase RecG